YHVSAVCTEAVHGELVAPDTVTWKGAHGKVAVDAAALTTGNDWRDRFARTAVLQATTYPQIVLTIDSVVNVRHVSGDTVHAVAAKLRRGQPRSSGRASTEPHADPWCHWTRRRSHRRWAARGPYSPAACSGSTSRAATSPSRLTASSSSRHWPSGPTWSSRR